MSWAILADLDEEERRRVLAAARRRRFARREVVFHEGDPGDSLHLIDKGRFAIQVTTRQGAVATMSVMGPGETFGELSLVDADRHRTATVLALEPAETLALRRADFDQLRRDHPAIDRLLVSVLVQQVDRLTARLLEALHVSAEVRVRRRLVELAELYDGEIPLTQEDLASMAGTSRATANRVLGEAESMGVVAMRRRRIEVVNLEALRRRSL